MLAAGNVALQVSTVDGEEDDEEEQEQEEGGLLLRAWSALGWMAWEMLSWGR